MFSGTICLQWGLLNPYYFILGHCCYRQQISLVNLAISSYRVSHSLVFASLKLYVLFADTAFVCLYQRGHWV